jgi:stearoyl-CoA desaturase (delta-9 desaturase)
MTPPSPNAVLDAPVTTIAYDEDDSRPLQQIPTTELKARWEQVALWIFIVVPLAAVVGAGLMVWGNGLSWHDLVIAVAMYAITGHGITVGFHRYFTHGSFKANRPLRIALAIAGSMAIEGPVTRWVADHRRHHAFSDDEGDPHSPWRYGNDFRSLCKGLWHAHIGWLFDVEQTDQKRFAPDLLADRDIARISHRFPYLVAVSLLLPALVGGLWSMSFMGAVTAYFWASLVRICVLHHVTWSINSICHTLGKRPFVTRDKSTNFWPLAIISMGESWHNLHHADPTAARHGVDRFQLDSSARLIWVFEKLGWAHDVRWPKKARLDARRVDLAA